MENQMYNHLKNVGNQSQSSGYDVIKQSTAVQGVTDGQQLGARIGHLVMYNIPSDFDYPLLHIQEAVEGAHLSFDPFLVYSPTDAFKKAIHKVRNSHSVDRSIFVRKAASSPTFRKYQMTVECRDGGLHDEDALLNYQRELFITLRNPNEKNGRASLEFSNKNHMDIQDTIMGTYRHARGHGDRYQFSRWAQHYIHEMAAVSMRSRGGVWFVAEKFTVHVKALQSVFKSFGATFHSFPIFQTESGEIFNATETVVLRDLRKFQQEVDAVRAQANDKGKPMSPRQLQTQRKKLEKFLIRIDVVEDLLSMQSGRIDEVLTGIEDLFEHAAKEPAEVIAEDVTAEETEAELVPELVDTVGSVIDVTGNAQTGFVPNTDGSPF